MPCNCYRRITQQIFSVDGKKTHLTYAACDTKEAYTAFTRYLRSVFMERTTMVQMFHAHEPWDPLPRFNILDYLMYELFGNLWHELFWLLTSAPGSERRLRRISIQIIGLTGSSSNGNKHSSTALQSAETEPLQCGPHERPRQCKEKQPWFYGS